MRFVDIFKVKQYKENAENMSKELERMNSLLTPEMQDALLLEQKIQVLKNQQEDENKIILELQETIDSLNLQIKNLEQTVSQKKSQIIYLDDEI